MTNRLPNLKINPEELPKRVLVCGDPFRAKKIASLLEDATPLAESREYHSFKGKWNGVEVGVVSHGVGSPGAAVCFEELALGGVKQIIRVGTAGSYQADVTPGSLVISKGAVRCDGLTSQLVPQGFPAVADAKIVEALVDAAKRNELNVHSGITLTLDVFYQGVLEFPHAVYQKAGVLAVEMEIAALYIISSLKGMKAGAIVAIDGYADADLRNTYNPHSDKVKEAVDGGINISLDALVTL